MTCAGVCNIWSVFIVTSCNPTRECHSGRFIVRCPVEFALRKLSAKASGRKLIVKARWCEAALTM